MYRELLAGCGRSREKSIGAFGHNNWGQLTTLDLNIDHKPDIVADLELLPYPFKNEVFDEIHAYEVLEHTGAQGDWKFFFDQFTEFHRILKPGGIFCISTPRHDSLWAWGDPSHKRIINLGTITFLAQKAYEDVGKTSRTDYRFYYKVNFAPVYADTSEETQRFVLRKV